MKFNYISQQLKKIERHLTAVASGFLTFMLVFQLAFYSMTGVANAATLNSSALFATSVGGMMEQAESQSDKARGDAEAALEKVTAKIRGNAKEVKNNGKEELGKIQSAGDDTVYESRKGMNNAERKAKEGAAKVEESKDNAIDAVKGFFGK
jgi:hypothetical protein